MIVDKFRIEGVKSNTRYVRKNHLSGIYHWCEVDPRNPNYDIAQGTCSSEDLPDGVRHSCDEYSGVHYATQWEF